MHVLVVFCVLITWGFVFFNLYRVFAETVFKVVNEEHDKLEAKKKAKHQNSITGEWKYSDKCQQH